MPENPPTLQTVRERLAEALRNAPSNRGEIAARLAAAGSGIARRATALREQAVPAIGDAGADLADLVLEGWDWLCAVGEEFHEAFTAALEAQQSDHADEPAQAPYSAAQAAEALRSAADANEARPWSHTVMRLDQSHRLCENPAGRAVQISPDQLRLAAALIDNHNVGQERKQDRRDRG